MAKGQIIHGAQLSAPVIQAPRAQRVDVSSGLLAVGDARENIQQRREMLRLNDMTLHAAKRAKVFLVHGIEAE